MYGLLIGVACLIAFVCCVGLWLRDKYRLLA